MCGIYGRVGLDREIDARECLRRTQMLNHRGPDYCGSYSAANIFLGAPGDCIFPGSAGAEVVLFMFVEIVRPNRPTIELPLGTQMTIQDQSIRATCDGTNKMILVGTQNGVAFQLAHNDVIAVDQGDTVRVRAGIEIFLGTGAGGNAEAIFETRQLGLNVPMVLIKIDS